MGTWSFWTFILVLIVLHFVLHLVLGLAGAAPDLLTVAVLLAARRSNRAGATGLGAVLGLLRDALGLMALGADVIALGAVAYVGARTREFFVGESWLFVAGYLFVGTWAHDALYDVLLRLSAGSASMDLAGRLLWAAPVAAAYAAVAGTVGWGLYRWLSGER